MDRVVNCLIIIKTFLIQQAGMCNGGLETGQIEIAIPVGEERLKEYSSLQDNPYNVTFIHTVLIVHNYFAPGE